MQANDSYVQANHLEVQGKPFDNRSASKIINSRESTFSGGGLFYIVDLRSGGRFLRASPEPPRRIAPAGSSADRYSAGVAALHSNQL